MNTVSVGVAVMMSSMNVTVRVPILAASLFLHGALLRRVIGLAETRVQIGRHRLWNIGVWILLVAVSCTGHVLLLVK